MSYIDQAIVKYWEFVAPIGIDAIRHDAQLILDTGTPCNESRGWYGTKPGCKRDPAKSAAKKAERKTAKAASKTSATSPKKAKKTATVSKKVAAKAPEVAGEKIAESIKAKGVDPAKVSSKKAKAAVDKNPKTASLPDQAKKKIVEKITSPEPAAKPKNNDAPVNKDPFDANLSKKNAIGKELEYDGVKQDPSNSRVFGAREEAKYFKSFDEDTQKGWLNDHIGQLQGVGGDSAYAKRAAYDFESIWEKTKPEVKKSIAEQWGSKAKNQTVKRLLAQG